MPITYYHDIDPVVGGLFAGLGNIATANAAREAAYSDQRLRERRETSRAIGQGITSLSALPIAKFKRIDADNEIERRREDRLEAYTLDRFGAPLKAVRQLAEERGTDVYGVIQQLEEERRKDELEDMRQKAKEEAAGRLEGMGFQFGPGPKSTQNFARLSQDINALYSSWQNGEIDDDVFATEQEKLFAEISNSPDSIVPAEPKNAVQQFIDAGNALPTKTGYWTLEVRNGAPKLVHVAEKDARPKPAKTFSDIELWNMATDNVTKRAAADVRTPTKAETIKEFNELKQRQNMSLMAAQNEGGAQSAPENADDLAALFLDAIESVPTVERNNARYPQEVFQAAEALKQAVLAGLDAGQEPSEEAFQALDFAIRAGFVTPD